MKKLEYTKENLRLLSFIISNATSGSQFTKLMADAGWTPGTTFSKEWQVSKKSKEVYLFDEFVIIAEQGRFDILDYIVEKTITKDQIYFKIKEREYKFPRQSMAKLKKKLKIVDKPKIKTIVKLFIERRLHNSVVFASKELFSDGHYSQSIFEACKLLNKNVQKISGLTFDGEQLMSNAFNLKNPKIKLNGLKTLSDNDEQVGFMYIFMGTMKGIRNPKGHELLNLKDPYRTLDYLTLISLLLKRLDERIK